MGGVREPSEWGMLHLTRHRIPESCYTEPDIGYRGNVARSPQPVVGKHWVRRTGLPSPMADVSFSGARDPRTETL